MSRSTSQNQSESKQSADGGIILKWLLLVKLPTDTEKLELGVESRKDALNWAKAIRLKAKAKS